MMNEQIIIEKMIEKFRFEMPVTPEVRKYISESKQRNLKQILKGEKKYGFFTGMSLAFFFVARKAGLTISFINAAVITATVTVITTAAIIAGSVSAVNYIIEKKRIEKIIPPPAIEIPEEKPVITGIKPVSIYKFSGNSENSSISEKTTSIIFNKLLSERGENNVFLSSISNKQGFAVTGSVEKNDTGYIITMKIIDPARGLIINMETVEISSENELQDACARLVKIINSSAR